VWLNCFLVFSLFCVCGKEFDFCVFVIVIEMSKDALESIGIPTEWVTEYWESFCNELKWIRDAETWPTEEDLAVHFNDPEIATNLVVWSRLLVSYHLQTNQDSFEPFIQGMGFPSLHQFVKSEVEPMSKEADFPQCLAFASYLRIRTHIEYLDNNPGKISHMVIPEDSTAPIVHILYRPGHYDVLIPLQ
jgi:ubiquitin thioesterase protein OTUB1